MSAPKLILRIVEVENGYIVSKDRPGFDHVMSEAWVASSTRDLERLIGSLAAGHKVEQDKAEGR